MLISILFLAVVHDCCCVHLQPLDQEWNQVFCQRSTSVEHGNGVVRVDQRGTWTVSRSQKPHTPLPTFQTLIQFHSNGEFLVRIPSAKFQPLRPTWAKFCVIANSACVGGCSHSTNATSEPPQSWTRSGCSAVRCPPSTCSVRRWPHTRCAPCTDSVLVTRWAHFSLSLANARPLSISLGR